MGIAKKISPNSICFPPNLSEYRPLHYIESDVCAGSVCYAEDILQPIELNTIDMYKMEASLRKNNFDRMIHFRIALNNPYDKSIVSGYSISKEAFNFVPTSDIAKEMAIHLKECMK